MYIKTKAATDLVKEFSSSANGCDTGSSKSFDFLLDLFCIFLVFVVHLYVVCCIYSRIKYCLNQTVLI